MAFFEPTPDEINAAEHAVRGAGGHAPRSVFEQVERAVGVAALVLERAGVSPGADARVWTDPGMWEGGMLVSAVARMRMDPMGVLRENAGRLVADVSVQHEASARLAEPEREPSARQRTDLSSISNGEFDKLPGTEADRLAASIAREAGPAGSRAAELDRVVGALERQGYYAAERDLNERRADFREYGAPLFAPISPSSSARADEIVSSGRVGLPTNGAKGVAAHLAVMGPGDDASSIARARALDDFDGGVVHRHAPAGFVAARIEADAAMMRVGAKRETGSAQAEGRYQDMTPREQLTIAGRIGDPEIPAVMAARYALAVDDVEKGLAKDRAIAAGREATSRGLGA